MAMPVRSSHSASKALAVAKSGKRMIGEIAWYAFLKASLVVQGAKQITAMVRVKNEEEFLYPSLKSILDQVDEVVLVDNLSTDQTQSIIRSFERESPTKVRSYQYNYELRKRGREHWKLSSTPGGRSSPHLIANYYNWCLKKCSKPYVLKWDGDMIATEAFYGALEQWRQTGAAILKITGANVHADRGHLIGAKSSDTTRLAEHLSVARVPSWISSMSHTYAHPQLFPSFLASFGFDTWWAESFHSPFLRRGLEKRFVLKIDEPCFLHLKFCKRDPYSDYSADFLEMVTSNLTVGPVLRPEWQELLRRWKV